MKNNASSQVKEETEATTSNTRRKNHPNSDKKYSVIQCTGYLKSWPPAKIGLEDQESDGDNESSNLSCLVAVGRILPPICSLPVLNNPHRPNMRPVQFISRHALDGKFLYTDQMVTLILGYLPHELVGSSMYEYYYPEEISSISECHKCALQSTKPITSQIYRFKTKDGSFVNLQTEWKAFKNPWTKEIDYLIAKNNLILSEPRPAEPIPIRPEEIPQNFDFLTSSNSNDIQRMINTHVEASKIGRQIAEQAMDPQRPIDDIFYENIANPIPDVSLSLPYTQVTPNLSTLTSIPPSNIFDSPLPLIPSAVDLCPNAVPSDFSQPPHTYMHIPNTTPLYSASASASASANTSGSAFDNVDESLIGLMEDVGREPPSHAAATDDNDEAAMAVIMSLLEADAGLGGPVDFSGLPWPLP